METFPLMCQGDFTNFWLMHTSLISEQVGLSIALTLLILLPCFNVILAFRYAGYTHTHLNVQRNTHQTDGIRDIEKRLCVRGAMMIHAFAAPFTVVGRKIGVRI